MVQVSYKIKNEEGLHARPASDLCKTAGRFKSEIMLFKDGEEYDAKSMLMVLCMGAAQGETIEIRASGSDEQEALDAVVETLDME